MGSIIKRFDRPLLNRKNAVLPAQPVKSTPEHDAKALHDSVAATLRMFREDDQTMTKLPAVKKDMQARERSTFRAKIDHEKQEVLAGILKRAKKSK
jgi:hypothetical protein